MKRMKISLSVLAVLFMAVMLSCAKEDTGGKGPTNNVEGPVFDFSTTSTYTLNVKYDVPNGYVVGFDVYAEYPFEANSQGISVKKAGITAVDKGFTDGKGTYSKPITLPSYVSKVYVYTTYSGVSSRLLEAEVVNGVLSEAKMPRPATAAPQSYGATRAGFNYNTTLVEAFRDFTVNPLSLGRWHESLSGQTVKVPHFGNYAIKIYGRPGAMSYESRTQFPGNGSKNDALAIDANVFKTINSALKGDGSGIPVETKFLDKGDIHVTKEAELDLIFIQSLCEYWSTLAYYCYPTNNPPTSVDQIKNRVVAIPNAMGPKEYMSNRVDPFQYDAVSMFTGEGVRLKYVDENGQFHDKFPAGTSVGWILYCDGYLNSLPVMSGGNIVHAVSPGVASNYSSPAFSKSPNTAVLRYGDFVVIGFDDADGNSGNTGYRDYLDVMFNVKSNPSDAIIEEIPDVDPEPPTPVTLETMGILLYEDLWPYQGDFDMNDVIVKYESKVTLNADNNITDAEVDFTILHSGATFDNSFAYYDPNISNATVTITGGEGAPASTVDKAKNIIRLADNVLGYANKPTKTTFTVTYKYNTPIAKAAYKPAPFDPFITIGKKRAQDGTIDNSNGVTKEVHLTNYAPTSYADGSWLGKAHDFSDPSKGLYYVTFENYAAKPDESKGQQLPFAVNIVFDKKSDMDNFHVTIEGKHINKHYSGFRNWVKTGGKESADWYLHFTN